MASSYDYNVIQIPNVPDLWTTYTFTFGSAYLYITIRDKPVNIKFSYDGVVFGDTMAVFPDNPPLEIPHSAKAFQMQNETAGLTAWAQAVAFR